KLCTICHQLFCKRCAYRLNLFSPRICCICRSIESNTKDKIEQLSLIKVKHLRAYLEGKHVANVRTCIEKKDLIDLILKHLEHQHCFPFELDMISTAEDGFVHVEQRASATITESNSTSYSSRRRTLSLSTPLNLPNETTLPTNINENNTTDTEIRAAVDQDQLQQQSRLCESLSDLSNEENVDESSTDNPTSYSSHQRTSSLLTPRIAPVDILLVPDINENQTNNETRAAIGQEQQEPHRRKSLRDLSNEENINDLTVKELKEILVVNFVNYKGCVEKHELIAKVRQLYRDKTIQEQKAKVQLENGNDDISDDTVCKVCMDAQIDCVFLDCGHMCTCVKCGKVLAECPMCRQYIVRVVRVFKA
ncbi:unnamed protein product, partial [Didymodactylos carnosus]